MHPEMNSHIFFAKTSIAIHQHDKSVCLKRRSQSTRRKITDMTKWLDAALMHSQEFLFQTKEMRKGSEINQST